MNKIRYLISLSVSALVLSMLPIPANAHTPPDFNFYPATWQGDLNVDYAFTTSVPGQFRQQIRLGASSWTDMPMSLSFPASMKFVEVASVANFSPYTCPGVYQKNGVHWVSGGILADILSGILGFAVLCDDGAGELESTQVAFLSGWYPAFDLWTVATHEFGHATGFIPHFWGSMTVVGGDSSACPGNTMCTFYQNSADTGKDPHIHDLHTFQNAYPPSGPTTIPTVPAIPPDPPPYDPWAVPSLSEWSALGLALVLAGAGLNLRRRKRPEGSSRLSVSTST